MNGNEVTGLEAVVDQDAAAAPEQATPAIDHQQGDPAGLTKDQHDVVKLLQKMLHLAQSGQMDSVGLIFCNGPGNVNVGATQLHMNDLYVGAAILQQTLLGAMLKKTMEAQQRAQQAKTRILRPHEAGGVPPPFPTGGQYRR